MNKTISTIIKAGFITAGLMGAVTLSAWWQCPYCGERHTGRVCPVTGNTQYGCGPAYGCWGDEVASDDEDVLFQAMARRRQTRTQGREDKVFDHLRRHGSINDLNSFVRKTQDMLANRNLRMVVGQGGYYQVIPEAGQLPQGFHFDVIQVRGQGFPPAPPPPHFAHHFDPHFHFGCMDEFDAFGCHEGFAPQFQPYGCHYDDDYGPYGCYPRRDYDPYGCGSPYGRPTFGGYGCRYY
ncbi:MAG: hypothetical protein LBJ78_03425 [Puniceicoccales bacterium]|nr:hypothetical protein [Puniceicoccales bacterium]